MKKLLIVVDYQNDFVNGSLGFPGAELLDPIIAGKIEAYRKAGDEIVFTLDTHETNYMETQEGRNLPIPHCIRGTPGHNLFGNTAGLCLPEDKVFEKPTFPSAELLMYLKDRKYESIELCGLVSSICVLSNAVLVKAALPEVPVFIDAEATAAGDAKLHEEALDILENLQVKVLNRK
ncbi:MAG TPA: cysteine hydrolase [Methanocorpusculum sp.]|nr:cysteine hydrolase [Methanocorpusculum sp.]